MNCFSARPTWHSNNGRRRCCSHGFGCFFWTFYTTILLFILSGFIFWFIFLPTNVKFRVTEASLMQFNLTDNSTLYYNLKLNITVRNPNKRIAVNYNRIKATAYYKKRQLQTINLTPFHQGHKNTSFLMPAFEGQQMVVLKGHYLSEYNTQKSVGIFNNINVDLDIRIRAKYGKLKGGSFRPPVISCGLKVPLISNNKSANVFKVTRCKTGYFFADRDSTD
ncbi:Late embryogenesis abundant protein [Quillaja saponaria]|uniref:Late embryogenesis abundant protein n=1 Tax=Quillaja saponaria TaxID=32244 RepID=A0AAD7M5E9_QUISA|nr:Late embryogenesis abundant protein [Quillaja saponaria]